MEKEKKKNIKDIEIEEVIDELDEENEVNIENTEDDFSYEELTVEDRIISIEKKVNTMFVLTIIISIVSLITLLTNFNTTSTQTEDEPVVETSGSYSTEDFVKVGAKDLSSLSKNKTIVVWIGRQGCGYCTQYVPTITSVGKKLGIDIHYIDLADIFDFSTNPVSLLDEESYSLLENFATDDENKDIMQQLGATPMTLVIKNNKIVGSFTGALPEEQVLEQLKAEGFKQK